MKLILRKRELNSIDFSPYKDLNLDIGNKYLYMEAGKEHYRLLSYISDSLLKERGNLKALDVGTNHGCSALALSNFNKVQVDSFDIVNNKKANFFRYSNINFHIKNLRKENYCSKIFKDYDIIFIDADKSDDFEWWVCSRCIDLDFKGYLIFDDYLEYQVVQSCVNKLKILGYKVFDLTEYGHYSGTHLIDFSGELEIECQ